MLAAVIILSILLFFALTFIIVLGIDEGWRFDQYERNNKIKEKPLTRKSMMVALGGVR